MNETAKQRYMAADPKLYRDYTEPRTYSQAKVDSLLIEAQAAALACVAEHRPVLVLQTTDTETHVECSCGQAKANGVVQYQYIWRDHILSLSPLDVTRYIERVRLEARLEQVKEDEYLSPSAIKMTIDDLKYKLAANAEVKK